MPSSTRSRVTESESDAAEGHQVPEEILALLADPPTLQGEDDDKYYDMLANTGFAVGARDLVDWILVETACSIAWYLRQLRAARTQFLDQQVKLARTAAKRPDIVKLAKGIAGEDILNMTQDQMTKKLVAALTKKNNDNEQHHSFMAQALGEIMNQPGEFDGLSLASVLVSEGEPLKVIEGLIESQERRYAGILREVDRRHLATAKLQSMLAEYVDGPNLIFEGVG